MKKLLLPILCFFALTTFAQAATIGKVNANNIGLVSLYTFDGADMTPNVRDKSGSGNNGQLSGAVSTTTLPGKIGQSLRLGCNCASGPFVSIPNNAAQNPSAPSGQLTIAFWVKYITLPSGVRWYFSNEGSTRGYGMYATNSSFLTFVTNDGTTRYFDFSSGAMPADYAWHHYTVTFSTSTLTVGFYIDGKLLTLDNTSANTNFAPGTAAFRIGSGSDSPIDGQYDDFRIYNRTLSATEIKALYNSGSAKVGKTSATASTTPLSNGLVGYWTLDGSKTNWATGKTFDSAGVNTGQLINMSTTTSLVVGKIGQALTFASSTGALISAPTSAPTAGSSYSACAWVMPADLASRTIMGDRAVGSAFGWQFGINRTTPGNIVLIHDSNVVQVAGGVTANQWNYVCVTWDSASTNAIFYNNGIQKGTPQTMPAWQAHTNVFQIGNTAIIQFSTGFTGGIDDVRVYNRVLSANEVSQLYNSGSAKIGRLGAGGGTTTAPLSNGLVGYWTLDGSKTNWATGSTSDSSGNRNTGQLISMSTTTSPAIGKVGQAFRFDGATSNISVADSSSLEFTPSVSVSFWMKANSLAVTKPLVARWNDVGTNQRIWAIGLQDAAGNIRFDTSPDGILVPGNGNKAVTINNPIVVGNWYHIVGVSNGITNVIYINGVPAATQTLASPGLLTTASQTVNIGGAQYGGVGFTYFDGTIDDVRVYNKALSAQEVQQLYNATK